MMRFFMAMIIALCATFVFAFNGAVRSETATPQAFVEAIYKPYATKGFRGIDYSKTRNVRRYFEPALANAIIKDMAAAAKRNEVPMLDGDPFIDAQDWQITDLMIEVRNKDKGKAAGTVKFNNVGQLKIVSLELVSTPAGWRIADIRAPSGSLRKLYKLK